MMARIRSLAVTPSGSSPSTVMAIVLNGASGSVWVASTCSTWLVPMPNASAPKAPWVEVCESPQTTVVPGWVSPSCGPTTWTTPCSTSPSGCRRTPNSAQFLRSVSSWIRETGSAIGLSMSMVGVLWSSVAMVRSRRRTWRPFLRSPSKACGLVTSCNRCRSMKSRSGSPSARLTTWSSQTFSASVLPIAFPPPGVFAGTNRDRLPLPVPRASDKGRDPLYGSPVQLDDFRRKLNLRFTE